MVSSTPATLQADETRTVEVWLSGHPETDVGDATDDKGVETEGKVDQAKGHLSESPEKVEDAFKKD